MADVVDQCERFDQIDVQSKLFGDGARNLRDFEGVGQTVAEVVGVAASEDLRFRFKAAESSGVNDAVTVPLEVVAIGMLRLRMTAAAGVLHANGVGGEHGESLKEEALSSQHSALSQSMGVSIWRWLESG
jgi:hypothetical protein